jgi:hypothetical protein
MISNEIRSRTAPNPVTTYLSVFKIEVSSGREAVYENGRQQVELTLSVAEARDYTLTEQQVNTLTVVYRTLNGQYEPLPQKPPENGDAFRWFVSATRDERFEYFRLQGTSQRSTPSAKSNAQPAPSPKADVKSRKYYVSTLAPGGSMIELFARIEIEGELYTTGLDPVSVAPVTAIALPNYAYPTDYIWEKSWSRGNPPGTDFINEWSLSARQARFSYGTLVDKPYGMIRWQRPQEGEKAASNVGVALPGDEQFRYNPDIELGPDFPKVMHRDVQSDNPHEIVVVLQASNIIPFNLPSFEQGGPCQVDAYDIDGNFHRIKFAFDDSQGSDYDHRTNLKVTILSPADSNATSSLNATYSQDERH